MINPFILNPIERIKYWRDLREGLSKTDLLDSLNKISNFWWQAPIQRFCLDFDRPWEWPSPWEIIYFNAYDTTARAVMMAETIILTFEDMVDKIELQYIKDNDIEDMVMILIVNGFVLNHQYNKVLKLNDIGNNYVICDKYIRVGKGWHNKNT